MIAVFFILGALLLVAAFRSHDADRAEWMIVGGLLLMLVGLSYAGYGPSSDVMNWLVWSS